MDNRFVETDRRHAEIDPAVIGLPERRSAIRRWEERTRWERFGNVVKARRKELGLSQRVCATAAKLSQTKWARVELGTFGVAIDALPGIAEALHMEVSEIYQHAGYTPPGSRRPPEVEASQIEAIMHELADVKSMLREVLDRLRETANRN